MQSILEKIYIKTYTEVPTKFQRGVQHTKVIEVFTPVPQEILDPRHVQELKKMASNSHEGWVTLKIEKAPQKNQAGDWVKRFTELYGKVQHIAVICK